MLTALFMFQVEFYLVVSNWMDVLACFFALCLPEHNFPAALALIMMYK